MPKAASGKATIPAPKVIVGDGPKPPKNIVRLQAKYAETEAAFRAEKNPKEKARLRHRHWDVADKLSHAVGAWRKARSS